MCFFCSTHIARTCIVCVFISPPHTTKSFWGTMVHAHARTRSLTTPYGSRSFTYTLKRMFIPLFLDSRCQPRFAIRFCVFRLFLIAFQRIALFVCLRKVERVRAWAIYGRCAREQQTLTFYVLSMLNCNHIHARAHTHIVSRVQLFSHLVFFCSSSSFGWCHQIPNFLDFLWFVFFSSIPAPFLHGKW